MGVSRASLDDGNQPPGKTLIVTIFSTYPLSSTAAKSPLLTRSGGFRASRRTGKFGNQIASRRAITAGQQLAGVRRNVCSSPDARRRADHQRIDEIPALTSFLDRLNRRYKCGVRLCSDVIREFQTADGLGMSQNLPRPCTRFSWSRVSPWGTPSQARRSRGRAHCRHRNYCAGGY